MSKFDDFRDAVITGAEALAKQNLKDLVNQAAEDSKAFLEKSAADMQRWTGELAAKQITKQEFTDLVQAKKAVAEMHALTQAGVALAAIERFRTGLINLVIDTAFKIFIPSF